MTTWTVADDAQLAADAAGRAAGVAVRTITAVPDLAAVAGLLGAIWQRADSPPLSTELLRALATAGSYVAGAYDGDDLVGACVGFFAEPAAGSLHSHIAGVSGAVRGRSVGFALKVHQRAWALARGVGEITWTYDPLVARNAWFNTGKLGAAAVAYLPDHYGGMQDALNAGDETDRLLVRWDLAAPQVVAACRGGAPGAAVPPGAAVALGCSPDGAPVPGRTDAPVLLVAVPRDVEALRRTDPALAARWRSAVRSVLHPVLADGGRITGFDRAGRYVLHQRGAEHTTGERQPWS
ncbi:Predicted acetyltransferase, GNAT superfamily [Klenkia soli]|uniref:Predicted acetyltransferase, GNAT superfamily n=1 Tax=Klenkia soli TaxID=1052260 RepID=A0A1H0SHM4_9ACTN|nr:GNAT family N-acetyltransferase [Klenkia soli]SDP41291.1 Predicted acetyltransferase, GNAT superfamily [Klenkia soli]